MFREPYAPANKRFSASEVEGAARFDSSHSRGRLVLHKRVAEQLGTDVSLPRNSHEQKPEVPCRWGTT